jgi:hypothetical protein
VREHAVFDPAGQGEIRRIVPVAAHGCSLFCEILSREIPVQSTSEECRVGCDCSFVTFTGLFAGALVPAPWFPVASSLEIASAAFW